MRHWTVASTCYHARARLAIITRGQVQQSGHFHNYTTRKETSWRREQVSLLSFEERALRKGHFYGPRDWTENDPRRLRWNYQLDCLATFIVGAPPRFSFVILDECFPINLRMLLVLILLHLQIANHVAILLKHVPSASDLEFMGLQFESRECLYSLFN